MTALPICSALAFVLAACAVTDSPPQQPVSGSLGDLPVKPAAPLYATTEPAPDGSALRVFAEPTRLVGWIAGSKSFAGTHAQVRIGGLDHVATIDDDNTFTLALRIANPTEATVRVGTMVQRTLVTPAAATEPSAYFVVERGAYRPGQKLAFAAFLRTLDADGDWVPSPNARVDVQVVSETKKTTAVKLALVADGNGRIAGEYTFSTGDPLDAYTISIPGYRGSSRVTLAEFRKTKVKLEVGATVGANQAKLKFSALDFLDHPVPGGSVAFTAQIVRQDPAPSSPLASTVFAYGAPAGGLARDEQLRFAAEPYEATRSWTGGVDVIEEVTGTVALDAKGTGTHAIPIQSDLVRGRHHLLVDAVIVDANGREQRTTRSIPLARADVRVQMATADELAATGNPIDVAIRVVDAQGRRITPANATVAAIRIEPAERIVTGGYYGGYNVINNGLDTSWNGGGPNGGWRGGPNGGRVFTPSGGSPDCRATSAGCGHWSQRSRRLRAARAAQPAAAETLAAMTAVSGGTARLTLDDAGAYRLLASVRLDDGTLAWSELGIAVRDRDELPVLALELDREDVREGDRITGRLQGRYRDAPVLVVVRDARGIVSRHRVVLGAGQARIDLPSTGVRYGAAVEAYVLGAGGDVLATQQLVHVAPARHALAIRTTAKDTYGPGETVDLGITVDRDEPVDVIVSVYDQSVLGIAPDPSIDPRAFYYADDRIRARAGLATLRAELGDVTIGEILDRARRVARIGDAGGRDIAVELLAMLDQQSIDSATLRVAARPGTPGLAINANGIVALLRYAGVRVSAPSTEWLHTYADPRALHAMRIIDLLERDMASLSFQRVADTVVITNPNQFSMLGHYSHRSALGERGISLGGGATGNASYSAGGNMSFSAPPPSPLAIGGASTDVVRRDFSDSAFWSATTRTERGRARVQFKLPDSLTNWHVVVTAVGRDTSVGRHVTKLRTVRDVMIWPMLPRQLTEGDVIEVYGTVHNLTGDPRDVVVKLEAQNVEILTPATVTIRIPRGKNVPVTWSVRAREPGMASLLMRASAASGEDASLKRIPIVAAAAEQLVTASGFADRPLAIALPDGIDPKRASLEITFAPSLAADMVDTLDYLVEYPYGCAEQTMSRFAPAIRVAGILDNLGIEDGKLAQKLPGVVDAGMKRLVELQRPDGGWGWNGHAETHEMITPYVVWGLIEAERAGYKVSDATTIPRGLQRIHGMIHALPPEQLTDRAYLVYVYSQRHRVPDAIWDQLVAGRDKLSDYALALVLETAILRKDTTSATRMAEALRARAERTTPGVRWTTGRFSRWGEDPFETTAVVMKALVAHDAGDPLIAEAVSYFVATKRGDRWNSTKDTAMILYAMSALLDKQGAKGAKTAFVDYSIDNGATQHLGFADGLGKKVVIDGTKLSRRTTLAFAGASPGMMARAVLRYRKSGRDLAPAAFGLDVKRQLFLLGAKGARVRELRTGDRVPRGAYVESAVTVASHQGQTMRFLLVEDPKPAGAEALPLDDPRFPRVPAPWVLREDRESHLAFHHQDVSATTATRTFLHLEMSGELVIAPAQAELMYQTQTRGHSGAFVLEVD